MELVKTVEIKVGGATMSIEDFKENLKTSFQMVLYNQSFLEETFKCWIEEMDLRDIRSLVKNLETAVEDFDIDNSYANLELWLKAIVTDELFESNISIMEWSTVEVVNAIFEEIRDLMEYFS